ncbi:MAG: hypothetical protein Kapaf2KO_19040 [Candidatus Kapaibacteriales bacterium]
MDLIFSGNQAKEISDTLGVQHKETDGGYVWSVKNDKNKQQLILTVYPAAELSPNHKGVLVSVQTTYGYFELHGPSMMFAVEPDEIVFVQENETCLTSMTIGGSAALSMFSNISKEIVGSDYSELDPAVLLAAMQLSLTDSLVAEG